MRARIVTGQALFVVLSTLAACGGDDSSTTTLLPLVTTSAPPTTAAPPTTVTLTTAPATTDTRTTGTPTTGTPTTGTPTTGTPTSGDSSTTSTSVPRAAALVLREDGLGDALFGADPDEVVNYVSSILGVPTDDSGWADPFEHFGICPGNEVRGVTWGDLQVLFSDESVVTSGRRHFFNYVYGPASGTQVVPAGMATVSGLHIGSTVAELRALYPGVDLYPEEIFGPYFVANENLSGFLTGVSDADTVISLVGGVGCGE